MTTPFALHYQAELAYLRDLGKEFSNRHPSLAGFLREPGEDPDVERLLEGFAFLTSRIRERIEGTIPEVSQSLCSSLFPHTLRPGTAGSVVEFVPDLDSFRSAQTVPAGTEVQSKEILGARCRFRTVGSLELLPIELLGVHLDESFPERPVLELSFRSTEAGRLALRSVNALRLHLWGKRAQSSGLALWFGRHLDSVEYHDDTRQVVLKDAGFQHALKDRADAHTAWPRMSQEGPRRLLEYLDFFEKLMFFDLTGLRAVPLQGPSEFALKLRFRAPPGLPERPAKPHIRLHCAPIVNLFETSAEPFRKAPYQREHLLRVAGLAYGQAEIVDLLSVEGQTPGRSGRRAYQRGATHGDGHVGPSAERAGSYGVRRLRSPVDGRIDTYLTFPPAVLSPHLQSETISTEVLCTNRLLPTELRIGDICVPSTQCPTRAKFSNISSVIAPTCPPLGNPSYWHYLGQVASSLSSFADPTTLSAFVSLHNLHDLGDTLSRGNQKRCQSIRHVEVAAANRASCGSMQRGIRSTVVLEEDNFDGPGDAYCFAGAIAGVLADRVGIDTFFSVMVELHPSQTRWQFENHGGTRQVL